MELFDFMSNKGKDLLDKRNKPEAIKQEIESSFEEPPVDGLVVEVDGENITLSGVAKDFEIREKVILIAGNIEGISHVNADQLITKEMLVADKENSNTEQNIEIPEEIFYTIEEGDTLCGIATKFYDDESKYTHIVDANLEVIKNPDLIYPGQTIIIPEVIA
ncbi:MAG: LysM peptidoglycan-binding domain-containing protein [Sulfurovaceae bacterium]|nr:LysM peptidoglycan-binding domain-containing protein [Sulfurovaceae bacterium]